MPLMYINDLPDNMTHKFKLYGKLIVELGTDCDDDDRQSDINQIVEFCWNWSMELSIEKCNSAE